MIFPVNVSERNKYILDQVRANNYEAYFTTISSQYKNNVGLFDVMCDALKIEGVRVNVTAQMEQEIADLMDCSLLTPKLADLIHVQSIIKVTPFTRTITDSTDAMINNSALIDDYIKNHSAYYDPSMLVSTVGKHWCIDNSLTKHPGMALNYGWHFSGSSYKGITGEPCASLMKDKSGMYYRVIQGMGFCHNDLHVDYSQVCVLVKNNCIVNGINVRLQDILIHDELSYLASHSGKTSILKQP